MVVVSRIVDDYYAVLQVHPGADHEVIEAAYRQLMKKYHPDVAGTDPKRVAFYNQRATTINRAYSVLRNPAERRRYDEALAAQGKLPPEPPPRPQPTPRRAPPPTEVPRSENPSSATARTSPSSVPWADMQADQSAAGTPLRGPLGLLAAAYYLLPGPYEWEAGRRQELLAACLLPPLGVAAFALSTGRFSPWIGGSLSATLVAWLILLLLATPAWRSLPRMVLAAAPSIVLISGWLNPVMGQGNMPGWLAWLLLGLLSLVVSARLYVFGVLPALGICWLLVHFA